MELIDTHCHLAFKPLIGDIDNVLKRSIDASVTSWINVGTDMPQNQIAAELADKFDNLYAAIGIHPHDAKNVTDHDFDELKTLAQNKKVLAIGETGLDFHYNFSKPDLQKKIFTKHLELAARLNLPVIIHSRQAFDDTVETLKPFAGSLKGVVFHCFSGTSSQAEIILDLGFHISFTGVVTFKNAHTVTQAAKIVPLDRLMLETDCPYMSPEPMRKQKTNEPALMIHTAKFLADLKNIDLNDLALAVTNTSKNFFNLS